VNSTSFCHLETKRCPVDIPVDFYVTGIIPRSRTKAAKLKPDFRLNFLLCLLVGSSDSAIWWSFNWLTQWRITFF